MLRTRITRCFPDAFADCVVRRWERMWATALLVTLTSLVPIAHASLPDPIWIAGTYDGADSDDVLLKAVSLETPAEGALGNISTLSNFDTVPSGATSAVPASTLRGIQARAPQQQDSTNSRTA